MHLCGGPVPVDESVGLGQLGGVGGPVIILRDGHGGAVGQLAQRHGQQSAAKVGQLVVQVARGVVDVDAHGLLQQHGAGIQAGFHAHDGHPGHGVTGHDGSLDGRGAAQARQQRGMHVDGAKARDVQHRLRQYQAVRGHHQHVGAQGTQFRNGVLGLEIQGLVHRHAVLDGQQFDLRRAALLAASAGAVGLGVRGDHLAAVPFQQVAQDNGGKARRAHEHHAQRRSRRCWGRHPLCGIGPGDAVRHGGIITHIVLPGHASALPCAPWQLPWAWAGARSSASS